MKQPFKGFGWQNFFFKIPANWDLVEEHGTEYKGYLRLATLEKNKLEFKWQEVPQKHNLLDMVTLHLKKIGWEENPIEKLTQDGSILSVTNYENSICQQAIFFLPKSNKGRLAIMRIISEAKENHSPVVKEICKSFSDEIDSPQSHWVFYECNYEIPSLYRRVTANIQAGNKELVLSYRQQIIYLWSISLASHFCPYKPINYESINLWIYDLLKKKFNREIILEKVPFLENQITHTKTSFLGRLLLRNLFHLAHNWLIVSKYNQLEDRLKITVLNWSSEKEIRRFTDISLLA